MPWTLEEVENHWLGGQHLPLTPEDLIVAIDAAEQERGRDWVLAAQLGEVYSFGKQLQTINHLMQAITGTPGADELRGRVVQGDVGADGELEAAHLLRSRRP